MQGNNLKKTGLDQTLQSKTELTLDFFFFFEGGDKKNIKV